MTDTRPLRGILLVSLAVFAFGLGDLGQRSAEAVLQLALLLGGDGVAGDEQLEEEELGSCTNYGECEAVCPKQISVDFIAQLNRDYLKAKIAPPRRARGAAGGAG